MGLSETILAAIIGALATMGTAIFQLVRNRAPERRAPKPKKNRMRSVLATVALMIGCIVGGYAWSSLRAVERQGRTRARRMEAEFTQAVRGARRAPESRGSDAAQSSGLMTDPAPRSPASNGETGIGRIARAPAALPDHAATRRSRPDHLHRTCRATHRAVRVDSVGRAHDQRARPGPRAEERITVAGTRCGRADARQPAHRGGTRRNIRSAPTSVRCVSTSRTGAWTTRWPCA